MSPKIHLPVLRWLVCGLVILLLTACGKASLTPSNPSPQPATPTSLLPTQTPTPALPTKTSEPTAASVNGEAIPLSSYNSELGRYQQAHPTPSPGDSKTVLDNMIDRLLLAQGAKAAGYTVSDAGLQQRIDLLSNQLGGAEALKQTYSSQGYDEAGFKATLLLEMEAAWMRDRIAAGVPEVADQAHLRQILLYNEDQAKQVYSQLQAGTNFATLAAKYDPVKAGDLGWIPKGYLSEPGLEEAAFQLQPGGTSGIIHTPLGYHILQVIERDSTHPLSPDARLVLQQKALKSWLEQQRSQSAIQVFLP